MNATATTRVEPGSTFDLDDEEAALVTAEATAAARVLDEPRRSDVGRLARAAATGVVPSELLEELGEITAASLEGGRARRLYRAEGVRILDRVHRRTPRGRRVQGDIDEVNQALVALAGRTLEKVEVASRTPGRVTVRLGCGTIDIVLGVVNGVVRVESVST